LEQIPLASCAPLPDAPEFAGLMIKLGELMMKTRKPAQAERGRKISDAIIAKSYLDLQILRDEVRKAETSRGLSLKPSQENPPPRRRQH
jgi:hypothetical protein